MKIKGMINSTRYFNRVYLWVTSAILLLVTIFSVVVYYNTENIVLKNEYNVNRKLLFQIRYNIDFMDETIKNVCKYLYFNSDVQSIMYNTEKEPDYADIILKMERLSRTLLTTNAYMHSFYVYNNNTKVFYSTYNNLLYQDKYLKEKIASYQTIPKLKPIHRKIEVRGDKDGGYEDVFTYFMYDLTVNGNELDGAVVVNVNFDWLLDNINEINMIDVSNQDQIFMVDQDGEFISNRSNEESDFKKSLVAYYTENVNKPGFFKDSSGSLKANIEGKEYILTYLNVENADFMLLKIQPSDKVYDYISKLRLSVIVITIIFLILTFLVSISITKGIYKPVGNLVKYVRSGSVGGSIGSDYKDEISFLDNVYRNSYNKLTLYEKESHSYKEILRSFWLKKLLTDSGSICEEDFDKARVEHRINITRNTGCAVCLFTIDNLREFEQNYNNNDRDLLKFSVVNITSEIISDSYVNDGVDLKDNHVALIINVDGQDEDFYAKLTEYIRQGQEYIQKYFNISISAAISDKRETLKELSVLYNNALSNSAYRFVVGRKSIITPETVQKNLINKRLDYSFALEKKLVDGMKSGNAQNIEDSLDKILSNIKELNYNNIVISLLHLIDTVRNTIDDINKSRLEPMYVNFEPLSQNLIGMETMDEFQERLLELLRNYFQKGSGFMTDSRHTVLVDTVQEVIGRNYHDSDLCLSSIAEMTKMSAKHLGRIFKERTQMSIPEYINEVRLERAAELLERSSLTVNEISLRVGIANETYFYSVFKKKFGCTPKEYTLKKALNKADDQN